MKFLRIVFSLFLFGLVIRSSPVYSASDPFSPFFKVNELVASPNFPVEIKFSFKATREDGAPAIKKIDLNFRLVGDVITSVRSATLNQSNSSELSATYQLKTQKDYIPPGARLSYYWTVFEESGLTFNTPSQEITYNDTRFNFKELQSGVVTVRWYQGDNSFGRAALDKATATIERLGRLYHLEPKTQINITIYPDNRSLFTALPPNTAEWVGGQAIPTFGTVVLGIPPGSLAEIGRSIPHEVSHQVVYQATRNPYNAPPKWLDEGLAVSNQDKVDAFLQEAFERGLDNKTLFPLRVLNGPFPADSQASYLAYAESLKVIQYITGKYGQEAIAKMLAAFKEGVTYDEAVKAGVGINLDQLDRDWKTSINYPVPAIVEVPTSVPGFNPGVSTPFALIPTPIPPLATSTLPVFSPSPEPATVQPAISPSPANSLPASSLNHPDATAVTAAVVGGAVPTLTPSNGCAPNSQNCPTPVASTTPTGTSNYFPQGEGGTLYWFAGVGGGLFLVILGSLVGLYFANRRRKSRP